MKRHVFLFAAVVTIFGVSCVTHASVRSSQAKAAVAAVQPPVKSEAMGFVAEVLEENELAQIDAVLDEAFRLVTREDEGGEVRLAPQGAFQGVQQSQQMTQAGFLERQRQKEMLAMQLQALKAEKNYYKAMTIFGGLLAFFAAELTVYYGVRWFKEARA